jgi:hypothetical protein
MEKVYRQQGIQGKIPLPWDVYFAGFGSFPLGEDKEIRVTIYHLDTRPEKTIAHIFLVLKDEEENRIERKLVVFEAPLEYNQEDETFSSLLAPRKLNQISQALACDTGIDEYILGLAVDIAFREAKSLLEEKAELFLYPTPSEDPVLYVS